VRNSALRSSSVKSVRDVIDREPLQGRVRNEFEASLCTQVKRSHQLVLRILLDRAGGRAECWPGNAHIADLAGLKPRNVQLILRALEAEQLIKCVPDRSLSAQRRIVILDHPNALRVLARLGVSPWMQVGAQSSAPQSPRKVHLGAQKSVGAGAQKSVGAGAQSSAPKLFNSELETSNSVVVSAGEEPEPSLRQMLNWPAGVTARAERGWKQDLGLLPTHRITIGAGREI